MEKQINQIDKPHSRGSSNRAKLIAEIPATEQFIDIGGSSTAVLTGGSGSPMILLHGPGETSLWWLRIIPKLVTTHRVIVPDLPGHGSSKVDSNNLSNDLIFDWLTELIEKTCTSDPILVGHLLGGSIAARFAINEQQKMNSLVLVDSFGLSKFRPALGFAFRLVRFMLRPTEKNYNRFLPQCVYSADNLRKQMGKLWEPFLEYNLECARSPDRKKALQILMNQVGIPQISPEDLKQITIPVSLIWGRHDRANKLQIAIDASKQYRWPLHIIEESRDDPKLEQPEKFINALYLTLNTQGVNYANSN